MAAGYGEAVLCPLCGAATNKIGGKRHYFCWNCETDILFYKDTVKAYKYTSNGNCYLVLNEKVEQTKTNVRAKPIAGKKVIVQYEKGTLRELNRFNSTKEASQTTGVNHSGISQCLNKRYKQSGGYVWRYADA